MKKQLLFIVCAALVITSCRKSTDSVPFNTSNQQSVPTSNNTTTNPHNSGRSANPFRGSMNYVFVSDYDLPCSCGAYYVVGNLYGTGEFAHLGLVTSRIKPCVSPIFTSGVHTGDHVAVECAFLTAANGDELDCYTHPYDLIYGPTAAVGTVHVDFVGGTGRFADATGSFTGTVTVPYGTGTASLTDVDGTINY